ncbi:serine/threonine protein phosphatase [Nocardia huaxiensis]|uniref:Serine/threonine protein phosphatase n=2 Tax=Nocardia huaxiensis TaxID=2755382 RepID=A0A7D7A2F3_9NOCA|nr:serine/threonine protein phosphatase [Nocardia huaxiensis]
MARPVVTPLAEVTGRAVSKRGRRSVNADSYAAATNSRTGRTAFAVADGVGDHLAAARAARLVATVAARVAAADGVRAGILAAQRELLRELPEANADCVVVVAVLPMAGQPDGPCEVAWIGDCRAYRWNGRTLQQITTDHTVAEYFRARGKQPTARMGHLVTTSARTVKPEEIGYAATGSSAGRLLLCSDGAHKLLDIVMIKTLLAADVPAGPTAETLVDTALGLGGTDNSTAFVVDARRRSVRRS